VNKKKNACMPSVRPSSFSLFLSPLLYPFSMCFPRQCRKATLNLYIPCERSDQPTTPFGQPTNPFPFLQPLDDDPDFYICAVCVSLSHHILRPPIPVGAVDATEAAKVRGRGSLSALSIYPTHSPRPALLLRRILCVSSMPK